ncbi:MAG: hypothetical protein ACOYWZ_06390 [Bacillota bacterium]
MEEFNLSTNAYQDKNSQPMSVGDWLKTLLLLMIPVVNIILMFVWAFGSDVNISKKNYFKANLILSGIILAIYFIIIIVVIAIAGFSSLS